MSQIFPIPRVFGVLPHYNFITISGIRKPDIQHRLSDKNFNCFDRNPACYGHTDGHTDTWP